MEKKGHTGASVLFREVLVLFFWVGNNVVGGFCGGLALVILLIE